MALFLDTKLVVDYDKKYEGTQDEEFTCKHCGRQFLPYWDADGADGEKTPEAIENVRRDLMRGCPSNDCPTHWEEQGVMYPENEYSESAKEQYQLPDEAKIDVPREADYRETKYREADYRETMVLTVPEMTWAELSDKISRMTQSEREQPVTVQHDGLDKTYHVRLEQRDSNSPVDMDGTELFPFEHLNCTEEVLMSREEVSRQGISKIDRLVTPVPFSKT